MNHRKKKNKRRGVAIKGNSGIQGASDEINDEKDQINIRTLLMAFTSMSLEEVKSAYREARGDSNLAAEILARVVENVARDNESATGSSSGGNDTVGSSSSSVASEASGNSVGFMHVGLNQKRKAKPKKVYAAAGSVSAVLGKTVSSTTKKGSSKLKEFRDELRNKEETEQFLCSMLGEECELSLAVVRDVLGQCDGDIEKALDVLLELSSLSKDQACVRCESAVREDAQSLLESNGSRAGTTSNSISHSSDEEKHGNPWFTGNHIGNLESDLPQMVLESLFDMSTPKTAECEPCTMNLKRLVKKMKLCSQNFESSDSEQSQLIHAKENDYPVLRAAATQHWASMRSYYQKATTAFTNGAKEHASYLSQQGRLHNKLAHKADEKASQDIFTARNKSMENVICIELHGQHVKQAMRILKLHLLFGACVRSVQSFEVITGCGSHSIGKSKLKDTVIAFLKKEGITWSEVNQGKLLIRLDVHKQYGFLDYDSESE